MTDTHTDGAGAARGTGRVEDPWTDLQAAFVDDPAGAVREASALLERSLDRIRAAIAPDGSDDTEALRLAFTRLRDVHRALPVVSSGSAHGHGDSPGPVPS